MRVSTRNLPALKLKYGSLAAAAKMSMANRPFPVQGDEIPMQEEPQPAQEDKPKLRGAMLGQYFIDDFCPAIELKSEPKSKTDFITVTSQNLGAWKNEPIDVTATLKTLRELIEANVTDYIYELNTFGRIPSVSVVLRRPVEKVDYRVVLKTDNSVDITSGKTLHITCGE